MVKPKLWEYPKPNSIKNSLYCKRNFICPSRQRWHDALFTMLPYRNLFLNNKVGVNVPTCVNLYKGRGLEKGLQRERERGLGKVTQESERRSIQSGPGYISIQRCFSGNGNFQYSEQRGSHKFHTNPQTITSGKCIPKRFQS